MASLSTDNVLSLPRLMSGSVVSVSEREKEMKCRYAFELNLQWSDGRTTTSFKGYQQFFAFQCELLDVFPQDSVTAKGQERIIPFLPGKQLFHRSTKSLALQRLPKLDKYLQEIIRLPERILTSNTVLTFLRENWMEEKSQYIVKNKDNGTSDDLLKSTDAVQVDDGIRVRYINDQRRCTPGSDVSGEVYFNEGYGSVQEEEPTMTAIDNISQDEKEEEIKGE